MLHRVQRRQPAPNSAKVFDSLLDACEWYTHSQNAVRFVRASIWSATMRIEDDD
jgi:hypothetical protein